MRGSFTGLRVVAALSLRLEVRVIAPWVMLITFLAVSSFLGYHFLLDNPTTLASLGIAIKANPAFGLLFGPVPDLSTPDGFTAWRSLALGDFFAGLMAILIVTRRSRASEESGQAELVSSGVVGRLAPLASAVSVAWIASILAGVVSMTGLLFCGGQLLSSVILSGSFAASGFVFAGIAAVTAQLASIARTANSLAVVVLGASFLVRGYADTLAGSEWVLWYSPLGWLQMTEPTKENNPIPLVATLGLGIALVAIAFTLMSRRDFGMGFIPPRRGPARGTTVSTVWGLAWRLHRGPAFAWLIGLIVIGSIFGSLSSSIGDIFRSNPQLAHFLTAAGNSHDSLVSAFLLMVLKILTIVAAIFGVQIALRVVTEETERRVEPLLANSLSRSKFLSSHAIIALGAPALGVVIASLALGVTARAAGGGVNSGDLVVQALAEIPALWILIALALAAVGGFPRWRVIAWLGVVATYALTILGPTFNLWDWILAISPLWHVPDVTSKAAELNQLVWLGLVVVGLLGIAFLGYRRRDVRSD